MTGRPQIAWFHCFSGVAGDMALGSLLDVGADIDEVRALCDRLPLSGWAIRPEAVKRCGIAGTKAHVDVTETGDVVRTAGHITGLLAEARLPDRVRTRAQSVFNLLATAEGRLHDHPPEKVHFHEVGSMDAIIDVVGTCAALEVLGVDQVYCSPIAHGRGMVRAAHGLLPVPAPAVVEVLRGSPSFGVDLPFELTTPTGAALMAALSTGWGPMPAMTIESTGFGAGTRELDGQPNMTQVVLGALDVQTESGQPIVLLETNVDDATGEVMADSVQALMTAGAHDAWITPITMKKGRPAFTLSVLCDVALARQLAEVVSEETGTLGVRYRQLDRWPAARSEDEVTVQGRPVRVKVSAGRIKVEHDDAARVAQQSGLPVRTVISLAEEAWRRRPQPVVQELPSNDDPGIA